MRIGAPPDFWVASRAAQIRKDPERTTFDLIVSHVGSHEQLIGRLPPAHEQEGGADQRDLIHE